MAKTGFGMPKRTTETFKDCPKCGTRMKIHECRQVRLNHKTYGEKGLFWVCQNVKQREKGREEYSALCDYRERLG